MAALRNKFLFLILLRHALLPLPPLSTSAISTWKKKCASVEDPRITPLQLFNSSNINNNHTPPSSTTNHASNFENPSSGGRLACGVLSILAQRSLVQFSSLRAVGNCPTPWLAAGNSLEIAFKDFETIFSLHRLLTIVYIVHCVNVGPRQSLRLGLV